MARVDGRRPVVIAEPGRGNNYQLLTAYTAGLASELERRGWAVTVARATEPDFLATLLRDAGDPQAVALLGHFFYDLRVSAQNHFYGARIGDLFRGRLCAMWADHPFTSFMGPRIKDADPRVVYCPAEPGFIEAAAFLNPQLARFTPLGLPVLYAPDAAPAPPSQRPIDVLVPLTFRDVGTLETYLAELAPQPPLQRLAQALYARLIDDRETYPFTLLREVLRSDLGAALSSAEGRDERLWLGVLGKVDLIVRNARRVTLVQDLLRDAAGLRVHVVGNLPQELHLPPGVTCEGALNVEDLGRRMAQSRWVVHCHPTYPHAQHERVLTAMATGCGVISDPAPVLDETFVAGREWLPATPGAGLRSLLDGFDGERLDALGEAARTAVQGRFGMAEHVDALLAGIEAHGVR
jgi:hypothetical protein